MQNTLERVAEGPWFFILFGALFLFVMWRNARRRSTLHRRDDGMYVWIEWHGGERCSPTDPSEPGGDWDSGSDGDGGGGD